MQASLYYTQGSSDKEYHVTLDQHGDSTSLFFVNFAYGRRGSTLNTGSKTPAPVPLAEAQKIFDKLVAEKMAKGYRTQEASERGIYSAGTSPASESSLRNKFRAPPAPESLRNKFRAPEACYIQPGNSQPGPLPQLLNAIDEIQAAAMVTNSDWCAQEKFDGKRIMIEKRDGKVTGYNRRGLPISLPKAIVEAVALLPDCLLDGESIGPMFYAFDLLSFGEDTSGQNLKEWTCHKRQVKLKRLFDFASKQGPASVAFAVACTAYSTIEKADLLARLHERRREGIVFKKLDAPYTPGRPSSGGPALKYKFVATCSAIVASLNAGGKRSVGLCLWDTNDASKYVEAGNVTILPNFPMPKVGAVVEVQYLYAFKESGKLYQPVYLGERDDIEPSACTVSQLKFKSEEA